MKNVKESEKSVRHLATELMGAGSILVLNSSYAPLNIVDWRRAFVLLLKKKAHVVGKGVIRLLTYVKIKFREMIPTRRMIHERDNHHCAYCGSSSNLSIDHVIPRSRGGKDTWDNMVTACFSCNSKKGSRTPEEANMILRVKPHRPHSKVDLQIKRSSNSIWKEYSFI